MAKRKRKKIASQSEYNECPECHSHYPPKILKKGDTCQWCRTGIKLSRRHDGVEVP